MLAPRLRHLRLTVRSKNALAQLCWNWRAAVGDANDQPAWLGLDLRAQDDFGVLRAELECVVDQLLQHELEAVQVDWRAEGFVCHLAPQDVPVAELRYQLLQPGRSKALWA